MKYKYTPRELKGNVNVSQESQLKRLSRLIAGILVIVVLVYIGLGAAIDIIVSEFPHELERALEGLLPKRFEREKERSKAEEALGRLLEDLALGLPENRRKAEYDLYIVENTAVNAFVLPPARIVIFSGLIEDVESENELVFVLAHELGHIANSDHLRALGRSLILTVASMMLLGEDNSFTQFLVSSLQNIEMKFSQGQEKAADLLALGLLYKKYGHVAGAVDFFEKIAQENKGSRIAYYFATHPYPLDRVENLKKEIRKRGYEVREKKSIALY